MNESRNVQAVQDIYAAFGRGDIPGIVERLAPDVTWRCHYDPVVPFAGAFDGKANVPKFFERLAAGVETQVFEPQDLVAQGDTVVSIGRYVCKGRASGKVSDGRWVFIWKFRGDGRISSYEQFHTAGIADLFR